MAISNPIDCSFTQLQLDDALKSLNLDMFQRPDFLLKIAGVEYKATCDPVRHGEVTDIVKTSWFRKIFLTRDKESQYKRDCNNLKRALNRWKAHALNNATPQHQTAFNRFFGQSGSSEDFEVIEMPTPETERTDTQADPAGTTTQSEAAAVEPQPKDAFNVAYSETDDIIKAVLRNDIFNAVFLCELFINNHIGISEFFEYQSGVNLKLTPGELCIKIVNSYNIFNYSHIHIILEDVLNTLLSDSSGLLTQDQAAEVSELKANCNYSISCGSSRPLQHQVSQ